MEDIFNLCCYYKHVITTLIRITMRRLIALHLYQYWTSKLCTIYQIELPRGNIAERTQYCSAWPRLQYALNTSAGAGPSTSAARRPCPSSSRPGPLPPNWPPRYLANNASPRATLTYHCVPSRSEACAASHVRQGPRRLRSSLYLLATLISTRVRL